MTTSEGTKKLVLNYGSPSRHSSRSARLKKRTNGVLAVERCWHLQVRANTLRAFFCVVYALRVPSCAVLAFHLGGMPPFPEWKWLALETTRCCCRCYSAAGFITEWGKTTAFLASPSEWARAVHTRNECGRSLLGRLFIPVALLSAWHS